MALNLANIVHPTNVQSFSSHPVQPCLGPEVKVEPDVHSPTPLPAVPPPPAGEQLLKGAPRCTRGRATPPPVPRRELCPDPPTWQTTVLQWVEMRKTSAFPIWWASDCLP